MRHNSRIVVDRLRRSAIVTLKSGEAFRGALHDADEHVLVLRNTEQIQQKGDTATLPVDGELIVFVCDVAYVQMVG